MLEREYNSRAAWHDHMGHLITRTTACYEPYKRAHCPVQSHRSLYVCLHMDVFFLYLPGLTHGFWYVGFFSQMQRALVLKFSKFHVFPICFATTIPQMLFDKTAAFRTVSNAVFLKSSLVVLIQLKYRHWAFSEKTVCFDYWQAF